MQFIWDFLRSMGSTQSRQLPEYRKIRMGKSSWRAKPGCESTMFLDEESSDVAIFVRTRDGGSRFPCHHAVLKAHMPTLDRGGRRITIENYTPEAMEQVLRFMYEGYINFDDWKTACDVLVLAHEYDVKGLITECEEFLMGSITVRNVCYLLGLALKCKLKTLQDACLEFCSDTAFIVLRTEGFYKATQDVVTRLTERDDLNVADELSVFNALWEWSKTTCIREERQVTFDNIGTFFERVAGCVRFTFMDKTQRNALPEPVKERYMPQECLQPPTQAQKRCLKYIEFSPISFTAVFEPKLSECADYEVGGTIPCWRFSINIDSYLLEINTMCEIMPKVRPIKTVRIVGETGTEFSWEPSNEKTDLLNLGENRVRSADSLLTVTKFRPIHMILLHAGTYSIEIEPQDSRTKWPLTDVKMNKKNSDVAVVNLAQKPCGLAKLQFLQAY